MATLRDIRRRLNSIKNIQQLTKAMEMVAASRLHQAQNRAKQSQPYAAKIKEILDQLSLVSTEFSHPLLEERAVKNKIGLVVVAADMGLSGSYNKDVLSAANKFLKNYSPEQIELILIGRKAVDYFSRRSWPIRFQLEEWGEKLTPLHIKTLSSQLISWFLLGELDEVWFVYTHYISMMARKVQVEKFLNIGLPASAKEGQRLDYLFEPDPAQIYAEILLRYCFTKVQTVLQESYASELAARIFAMKAATSNAEEMIEKLTLVRNKVRQAGITKEMLEITSGAEGLK